MRLVLQSARATAMTETTQRSFKYRRQPVMAAVDTSSSAQIKDLHVCCSNTSISTSYNYEYKLTSTAFLVKIKNYCFYR
jgi:hypothetical protein